MHTAIILENGDPVEVQIRTYDMHNYAEYGFAAHWAYKINKKVSETDAKINYIRSILELYKEKSNDELLETLKTDKSFLFAQETAGEPANPQITVGGNPTGTQTSPTDAFNAAVDKFK